MTEGFQVPYVGDASPVYAHSSDAGADLVAAEAVVIPPGARRTVPTGVAIAIPQGYVGFVTPRSGLAAKHGITVLNAPGTVDAGYRGELRVTLLNTDTAQEYEVHVGDRIAQIVFVPFAHANFVEVTELSDSDRGARGFGSTGYRS